MQNRLSRGLGKPVWVRALRARAFDWDPIPRIALGPAAVCAASTGRTHDCTRPICSYLKSALAKREPSTHDPKRTDSQVLLSDGQALETARCRLMCLNASDRGIFYNSRIVFGWRLTLANAPSGDLQPAINTLRLTRNIHLASLLLHRFSILWPIVKGEWNGSFP